jgi:HAD superfamily hydrolase (TIGR01509 family)
MARARAVLWDLDGVLVDSRRYHFEAFQRLLAEHARELSEKEFAPLFGLRNDAILARLFGELTPERRDALAQRKETLFRAMIAGRVEALPGAVDLVSRVAGAGIAQAIVSSTPRANINLILRSLGVAHHFDAIVADEDVTRGKPHPEGFTLAAQRLGVTPDACVVLEDAPEGVEAGNAAGARTIGVATTRRPEQLAHAALVVPDVIDARAAAFILED